MNAFNFIKIALKDYKVGALTVSSKYTVNRVLQEMPSGCKLVIEYGAGEGAFTKEILKRLPPDGRLVVIELNRSFIFELKKIQDKRLRIINEDVLVFLRRSRELQLPPADAIISGIPFTLLSPAVRRLIVDYTYGAIAYGGVFLVYQYSLFMLPILKRKFQDVKIGFEARNLPPYFVMIAKKRS